LTDGCGESVYELFFQYRFCLISRSFRGAAAIIPANRHLATAGMQQGRNQ
jgi:hypothetical protein